MSWVDDRREMERYTAELKQLLAGRDLSPDTRARSLAALIEADAVTEAAEKVRMASQEVLHDTYPLVRGTLDSFGEKMQGLRYALDAFGEPATQLAAGLRRLPDR